ncbi:hypothetical protein ACTWPT_54915 [Nonomuraea sp. 3N208]|uniref:hypothetical protein n=1 Tax=Nonomuraea sp. 3N208 TaxID=3457421 RepID=UPI003FD35177
MDERLRRRAADVGAGAVVHAVRLLDEHDALAETAYFRGHVHVPLEERVFLRVGRSERSIFHAFTAIFRPVRNIVVFSG